MKAASVKEIRTELEHRSSQEVMDICLRLSRFKKENKELLTYLLFDSSDENDYVERVKHHMDVQFDSINTNSYYYIRKSVRKILREVKKYIRFSPKKETEVELIIYFCQKLIELQPSIKKNKVLINLFNRQLEFVQKKILLLHEDLQYDYNRELEEIGIKA